MKSKVLMLMILSVSLAFVSMTSAFANGKDDLAEVRASTAQFHRVQAAMDAGWVLVPGLDHCFENAPTGAMGFHYINTGLLDLVLEPKLPEAMVYAPGPNGKLMLAAVEYIVPAEAWDAAGNSELPEVLGHSLHLNEDLGVYVLHAWIWKHNPDGMFEDWNPTVSCP
jgi:hypothetical protein